MFEVIDKSTPLVTINIDGHEVKVPAGATVATALIIFREGPTRFSPAAEEPRAPYCLMGTCFECLVDVDGASFIRGCMTPVRAGIKVKTRRTHE